MALKRAYLIIVLSFACLIGGVILSCLVGWVLPNRAFLTALALVVAFCGFEVGVTIGISEVALAKGYSIWLGMVLGVSGPLGLLIVELLPDRWNHPR